MQNEGVPSRYSAFLPYTICSLAALFYLYEFILQASPGVMTHELMRDLNLNAAGLGIFSAAFYYAYAFMQFPAGVLYDRYGPRLLLTIAIFVCASGAFFFGLSQSAGAAFFSRFLIGIGSAFSFIGALILVSRWFPARYFAVLAGLVQFMSSIGAIIGEYPLAKVMDQIGWRHAFISLAIIGFTLALAVWWFVRDRPEDKREKNANGEKISAIQVPLIQSLKELFSHSQTWIIGLYAFVCWSPIAAFAVLWGVPYLTSLYGISASTAAAMCSMIWLGIGLGSPFIGWWSDYLGRRRFPLIVVALIGFLSLGIIVYIPHIPFWLMFILLFCFGLAGSGQSLTFALVADTNRPEVVGTGMGFNNMAVVAGGMIFQPLIGVFLQWGWDGQTVEGVNLYTLHNYRMALWILPLCYLVAYIVSMKWIHETYCKPQHRRFIK
ncbi:MAG: MFS transporter [Gammaproteobacteria bacterium]